MGHSPQLPYGTRGPVSMAGGGVSPRGVPDPARHGSVGQRTPQPGACVQESLTLAPIRREDFDLEAVWGVACAHVRMTRSHTREIAHLLGTSIARSKPVVLVRAGLLATLSSFSLYLSAQRFLRRRPRTTAASSSSRSPPSSSWWAASMPLFTSRSFLCRSPSTLLSPPMLP